MGGQGSGQWRQQQLHILLRRPCLVHIFPFSSACRICPPSPPTDPYLLPPTSPTTQDSCSPSTSSPPPSPRLLPGRCSLALLPVASLPHLPQPHPLNHLQLPHRRCHHLLYHPNILSFNPPSRPCHISPPIFHPPPHSAH